jgi:hypothetical protein
MLILVAAFLELIAAILKGFGINHGGFISWQEFLILGLLAAFIHWGFGWQPYSYRSRGSRTRV